MLQKKKDEEIEQREREEAHARWEAEREELQRNSATRRSIDPSVFRRRNSLGGSIGGSRRDNSKVQLSHFNITFNFGYITNIRYLALVN